MVEVKVITVKKAKALIQKERVTGRRDRKKSPIIEEYEGYLRKLQRGKAIGITLKDGDKFQTIKYRLNNAAKSLSIKNLKIERAGNKVVVYKEVRPRTSRVRQNQAEVSLAPGVPTEEHYLYQFEHEPEGAPPSLPPQTFESSPSASATDESSFADTSALTPELTPSSTPVQQDEVMTFDEEYQDLMVHGLKTCETTIERYPGDTFDVFGDEYVITKVEQLTLGDVAEKRFKEHGLYSPKEFREVWKERHGGTYDPEQKVWLHHFRKRFELPIEVDSDANLE